MNADRDYFAGCHNVPMFDTDTACAILAVAGDELDQYLAARAASRHAASLADRVREIDARRVVDQLELPAELMPRPEGQLFA